MNRLTSLAVILMASWVFLPWAEAQTAYRCGDSYSQTPCPGGVPVDADDSRSKAQKAQSESVIKRDLRTADSMEKNRLHQEEALKRATQRKSTDKATDKPAAAEPTPGKKTHSTKKNAKNSEYFTARTSGDKKKKKSDAAAPAGAPTGNTSTAK